MKFVHENTVEEMKTVNSLKFVAVGEEISTNLD